ncbi:FHA domain-containing protein [Chloropicon primus]|nr:FHA domain-containing protein [Chloropicon primus]
MMEVEIERKVEEGKEEVGAEVEVAEAGPSVPDDMRYDGFGGEVADEAEQGGVPTSFLDSIPDALSAIEVVRRRKEKVARLIELYKEQYWVLLDELSSRAQKIRGRGEKEKEKEKEGGGEQEDKAVEGGRAGGAEAGGGGGVESLALHYASKDCDLPSVSEVEEDIVSGKVQLSSEGATKEALARRQKAARQKLGGIRALEKTALSIFSRRSSSKGALACLVGKNSAYFLSRPEMSVGRNTKHQLVDVDLSLEGNCSKVSRQQGIIKMLPDGSFHFQNFGQRKVRVDNKVVPTKRRAALQNGSFLDFGGLRFLFLKNPVNTEIQF